MLELKGALIPGGDNDPLLPGDDDGTAGTTTTTSQETFDCPNCSCAPEVIIDPSFENTKAECIYIKMKALSTGFKEAIQKFDGEFPVAHLAFKLADLGQRFGEANAPGENQLTPDYVITITLNNNLSPSGVDYRPNLLVAKTIIHEVIHAEMYRKLLSLANQGNLDFSGWTKQEQIDYMISIRDNFPGIYDYYRRHKNWQHQQMATHYRETIAVVLNDFDNGQHSDQFYMDLAWEGLRYDNIYIHGIVCLKRKRIE